MVDPKNLLDDDKTTFWLALRFGPVGAELEPIRSGQRNIRSHANLPDDWPIGRYAVCGVIYEGLPGRAQAAAAGGWGCKIAR
jgi:hypothetical protein